MTATTTARDMHAGIVYRATVESVQRALTTEPRRQACVRVDVDGQTYALVTRYDDDTIVAMFPPGNPDECWALSSNFVTSTRGNLSSHWPDWRGWGLDGGTEVEVIDDRGEIEEFRTRVHAAVSKEGRDRGWCSEADEWLLRLGLPQRGVVMNVSVTGSMRVSNGATAAAIQSRITRLLASERGLTVVVTQQPEQADVAF